MLPIPALTGIRVLDLTRLLPGPMATQWIVEMGAEVIKVEDPALGDYMRNMSMGPLFDHVNQGKKSITLNLKDPAGREKFLELCDSADAVIEGFRPDVMDRLQCGWKVLRERQPKLVYVALTGYGYHSPYRDLAGHDINYLALAGVLDLIGPADGPPSIPGIQIADLAGGSMHAVIGILAALLERQRTGRGQFVDVSMMHGSAKMLPVPIAQTIAGSAPRRGSERLSGRYACYNVYRAGDGRYVAVGALEPKFWVELCRALGCEDYIADQFAEGERRREIMAGVQSRFEARGAEEWFTFFRDKDACVTPVRTVAEAMSDIGEPPLGRGPGLGEHNSEFEFKG